MPQHPPVLNAPTWPQMLPGACSLQAVQPRLEGLDAWVHQWQGRWQRWRLQHAGLRAQAVQVLQACEALSALDDAALALQLQHCREQMRRDPAQAKGHLLQALAMAGHMAHRSLGLRPYVVQFMGALTLHQGHLAEMATGEGKTLTVGLAAVLAAWSGRACHVITANDYLAQRDAQEMQPLLAACGVSVASVFAQVDAAERPHCYAHDVVYLTAKELLADHLRDEIGQGSQRQREQAAFGAWLNAAEVPHPRVHPTPDLAPSPSPAPEASRASAPGWLLVRGLHTAIVDEADSILIDEAATPLILAAPRESRGLAEAVGAVAQLAEGLVQGQDYQLQTQARTVSLLPAGVAQLSAMAPALPPVWRPAARREELLRQALLVRHFFWPGHHYVVHEDEIVLLDEFTGRMTPGRALTAGLHQAIEAHQGVPLTQPNESLTQMSFQAFFSRFAKLCGCTGTGFEVADELWRVYALQVRRIPTHRPRQTVYHPPCVLPRTEDKWAAIAQEVRTEHAKGRPVLVGVRSVAASQDLARLLQDLPDVQVLNALNHLQEAAIVAAAGAPGRVTLATNMAGRGTDIRLGEAVAQRGGLHVIVAEINESARVDRQLAGRCGRQGDPGSVSTYYALDDALAERMLAPWLRRSLMALARRAWPGTGALAHQLFHWAQRQTEAHAFARRWSVLKADEWMRSALPFQTEGGAA